MDFYISTPVPSAIWNTQSNLFPWGRISQHVRLDEKGLSESILKMQKRVLGNHYSWPAMWRWPLMMMWWLWWWHDHDDDKSDDEFLNVLHEPRNFEEPGSILSVVKSRKRSSFGHATHQDILSEVILQGYVEGEWRRARQRKLILEWWHKGWTGYDTFTLLSVAEGRERWRTLITDAAILTPKRPTTGFTGWDEDDNKIQKNTSVEAFEITWEMH